jgi:exodeoxyribonuclease-3
MIKIITLNVNGIRAAAKKGVFEWLCAQHADIICLQETKAQEYQLRDDAFHLPGYQRYFHDAKKAGYSGVAIFCKHQPSSVKIGLGWSEADDEGRYIQIDYKNVSIASVYFPSGTTGEVRQAVKFDFLKRFAQHLDAIDAQKQRFIFCGDINIAHKQIDLKNWRGNQKNSGFLPEERAWMDELIENRGFIDCFRSVNPHAEEYSWWSARGQAWAKNVGWRIDYQFASPWLKAEVLSAKIYREQRFSDHSPVIVEYSFDIEH